MPTMDPQEPGGRQLAVPDGSPGMPEEFVIGTTKAFARGYAYEYEKRQIRNATIYDATIYVCKRGNDWAEQNEQLVLLRDRSGIWTAWDSHDNQSSVALRQPIFRCPGNITQPGWYKWETKYAGSGLKGDWHGALEAEDRVPCCNDASCVETTRSSTRRNDNYTVDVMKGQCNDTVVDT